MNRDQGPIEEQTSVPPELSKRAAARDPVILAPREPLRRLLVENSHRGLFISIDTVQWIEADRHFVKLHLPHCQSHRIRTPISALYEKLDQDRFLRINRSAIVNLDFVSELRARNRSDREVLLRDGTVLSFSRLYRNHFKRLGAIYDGSEPL